ncbi:TetR/AcrR family transcriptional regulator [Pimelobacter simplex]|uniref:TetR/AcrR family transcriptional regulator n=1 Tax=Nocardioides simplex TaxID=2045 RepID=A0A7J5DU22_NOCSI|nr:TetR/AcrR family transcriptional regulator [Pimelobacter simplex]KAB2808834.1 TetR/AcrR family transcriptional regulator [Pimelobacter simplex]
MSTTPSVRRRLTAPARRERIEAAAVEVFAGRGYDAASVGAIAAAAGVSRTVLYDHFRDKRALYLHVLGTENAAMLAEVGAGITGAGAGRARMRATVAAYLSFAQQRPAARRLLVDPVPTGDAGLDEAVRTYRTARTQAVAEMLGPDLVRAGLAPGATATAVVVELLITGVDGVARWWQDHPEATLDEVTDVAARLLWSGLPRVRAPRT